MFKYLSHQISNVERFRRSLEGLNIREDQFQKLTEAQKDFLWFIHILKSLPKVSDDKKKKKFQYMIILNAGSF